MSLYVLPVPHLIDGGLALPGEIEANVADGLSGVCVACRRACWTWWSPAAPGGYVPLHRDRCPARLRELWAEALKEGDFTGPEAPAIVSRGRGAYGRRAAAAAAPARPVVALSACGIEVPEGFTPGPFWKPGHSHLEPWVVVYSTGTGGGAMPYGRDEAGARDRVRRLKVSGVTDAGMMILGATLIAPNGAHACEWGAAPMVGQPRWEGLTQLSEWRRCAACAVPRWPGSWLTLHTGRCQACQEPFELDDPRPWPVDPADPGLATAPDYLGGPKKTAKRAVGIG